jgi:hypothetical protein
MYSRGIDHSAWTVTRGLQMIEHKPWPGANYKSGIDGQRIAIVGYSHHRDPSYPDCADFTIDVVRRVISGKQKGDSLFATVAGYFGYEDRAAFWNSVMFFNFLPHCVGTTNQRYNHGTSAQIECGKERFLRILRKEKLDKVLVFTAKGWSDCPETQQEKAGKDCLALGPNFPSFSWGTYSADDHTVAAFGLRHPQYADGKLMRAAVQRILAMRVVNGCPN